MSNSWYYALCLFHLFSWALAASTPVQPTLAQANVSALTPLDPDDVLILADPLSSLLNASVNPLPPGTDSRILEITCFADRPLLWNRQPIQLYDFSDALVSLLSTPNVMINYYTHFLAHVTNLAWRSDSCDIAMKSTKDYSTAFPLVLTANTATLIFKQCVTSQKRYLGGYARMFSKESSVLFMVRNPAKVG